MDTIVIICLIAGAVCIGASFLMKEKTDIDSQEKEKLAEEIRVKALSEESIKKVMTEVEKKFTGKLSDIAEDKLEGNTDRMSEIANNKMLAINEMSGQLIEKIEQNHKEVIFLYDMLNEKSDNLKDFSAKIDGLRKELEDEEKRINALNQDLDDKLVKVKEVRKTVIAKPAKTVPAQQGRAQVAPTGIEQLKAVSDVQNNIVTTQANTLVQMQKKEQEIVAEQSEAKKEKTKQSELATELSTNDKILLMKEEGKSVIEISKALRMGQGEVQLILGLFGK
jgi:hypothetical protein